MNPVLALSGHPNALSRCPLLGVKRTSWRRRQKSASDAVDGASSEASKCYSGCVGGESNKGGEATVNVEGGALKELARTRRRNADKVDPWIGRTRLGQRIFECVLLIGTRSAQSIMASGFTAAQTGRTHDRTRPMLQLRQKVLAKAPSTHDPKRTFRLRAMKSISSLLPMQPTYKPDAASDVSRDWALSRIGALIAPKPS
jgi:hypothetical protein